MGGLHFHNSLNTYSRLCQKNYAANEAVADQSNVQLCKLLILSVSIVRSRLTVIRRFPCKLCVTTNTKPGLYLIQPNYL